MKEVKQIAQLKIRSEIAHLKPGWMLTLCNIFVRRFYVTLGKSLQKYLHFVL